MLYYHTCTPPQDIYDEMVQHFHGLARSFGYIGIYPYIFSAVLETESQPGIDLPFFLNIGAKAAFHITIKMAVLT